MYVTVSIEIRSLHCFIGGNTQVNPPLFQTSILSHIDATGIGFTAPAEFLLKDT